VDEQSIKKNRLDMDFQEKLQEYNALITLKWGSILALLPFLKDGFFFGIVLSLALFALFDTMIDNVKRSMSGYKAQVTGMIP
jgi:hypothetical protein